MSVLPVILTMASAVSADSPVDARSYPSAALKLADSIVPELAHAIENCDAKKAQAVREQVLSFIYKEWKWNSNYDQLKPYRECYRMLSDISATTQLVTNKYSNLRPYAVAGPFDASYAACRRLAEPGYELKGVEISARWPARFGTDPGEKTCTVHVRTVTQSSTTSVARASR
jgi:hypothetical protein